MYNTPLLIINSTMPLHCKGFRKNSAYNKIMTRKIFKPVGSPYRSPLGTLLRNKERQIEVMYLTSISLKLWKTLKNRSSTKSAYNEVLTRKIFKPVGSPCRSPLGHIAKKQRTTDSSDVPEFHLSKTIKHTVIFPEQSKQWIEIAGNDKIE